MCGNATKNSCIAVVFILFITVLFSFNFKFIKWRFYFLYAFICYMCIYFCSLAALMPCKFYFISNVPNFHKSKKRFIENI